MCSASLCLVPFHRSIFLPSGSSSESRALCGPEREETAIHVKSNKTYNLYTASIEAIRAEESEERNEREIQITHLARTFRYSTSAYFGRLLVVPIGRAREFWANFSTNFKRKLRPSLARLPTAAKAVHVSFSYRLIREPPKLIKRD